jgi:hypothetical protein
MVKVFINNVRVLLPASTTIHQALVWWSTSGDLPRLIPKEEDLRVYTSVVVFGECQACTRIGSGSFIVEGMRLFTTISNFKYEQRLWLNLAAQRGLLKCPKLFLSAHCIGGPFFMISADPRPVLVVGPCLTSKGLIRLKAIWQT